MAMSCMREARYVARSSAIRPELRGRLNCSSGVFFTVPLAVAMKMKWSASYSLIGRMVVIRSSASSGNMFTNGRPLAPRLA